MNTPKPFDYQSAGQCHPKLARGMVWCKRCGASIKVDSGKCLRTGWPECCGETMTIDSPEERKEFDCDRKHQV